MRFAGGLDDFACKKEENTMTFQDIFKSGFLEGMAEFSLPDILIGMLFTLITGLFIFVIYDLKHICALVPHLPCNRRRQRTAD